MVMKKITAALAILMTLCFFLSSCVMGGGEEDQKDPREFHGPSVRQPHGTLQGKKPVQDKPLVESNKTPRLCARRVSLFPFPCHNG